MRGANATVRVELHYIRKIGGGIEESYSELTIVDALSAQTIVALEIEPSVMVSLLSSSQASLPAWVCPPYLRARIGQQMVNELVYVPTEIIGPHSRGFVGHDDTKVATAEYVAAEEWAEATMQAGGWESWELRHQNDGWVCVFRKWEPVVEAPNA